MERVRTSQRGARGAPASERRSVSCRGAVYGAPFWAFETGAGPTARAHVHGPLARYSVLRARYFTKLILISTGLESVFEECTVFYQAATVRESNAESR